MVEDVALHVLHGSITAGGMTPLLLGTRAEPGTACGDDVIAAAIIRLLDESTSLTVHDPRGFVDVAAEFMPQAGGVSMARFLKDRA